MAYTENFFCNYEGARSLRQLRQLLSSVTKELSFIHSTAFPKYSLTFGEFSTNDGYCRLRTSWKPSLRQTVVLTLRPQSLECNHTPAIYLFTFASTLINSRRGDMIKLSNGWIGMVHLFLFFIENNWTLRQLEDVIQLECCLLCETWCK